MSLKCSLFGHNYGDTERRRDREENGTELVETTREVKACTRCGETLVVSEATEVTTLQTADATAGVDADADRRDGTETGPADGADTPPRDGTDTVRRDRTDAGQRAETDTPPRDGTDTVRRDRTDAGQRDGTDTGQEDGTARGGVGAETGRQDGQSTAGRREEQIKQISTRDTGRGDTPRGSEGTTRNGAATGAEAVSQGGTDGDAEPSDTDQSPGSRSGRSEVAGPGPAGETGTADTADTRSRENSGTGTEDPPVSRKNDAFIIDEDGEERRPTEWPGPEGGDGDDTAGAEDWQPEVDTDDSDTPPEPATRSTAGHTVPEGEFYCPECEFTTLVEFASSLREGDFCPECHRAALEHRSE